MLSVVIPYMAKFPYDLYLDDCLKMWNDCDLTDDVILSDHPREDHIRKNRLINEGIAKAKHETIVIWDVDIRFGVSDCIKNAIDILRDNEIVFFSLYFVHSRRRKFCDGVYVTRKKVFERYGKHDESFLGIGGVTFPFLWWALNNTKWVYGGDRCIVTTKPVLNSIKKRHPETFMALEKIQQQCFDFIGKKRMSRVGKTIKEVDERNAGFFEEYLKISKQATYQFRISK